MFERSRVPRKTLVVFSLLLWTGLAMPPLPKAHAATTNITLLGLQLGWNGTTNRNPIIRAVRGNSLSISLSSGDFAIHEFYVDVDGDNMSAGPSCLFGGVTGPDKCSYQFPPSTIFNFTVDFAPGNYTYFCAYHPDSMFGRFLVVAPPAESFAISANPSSLHISVSSASTSTIMLQSFNGFSGNLTLTASSTPNGLGESFSKDPVWLNSNGTSTSTITVSSPSGITAESYQVAVTATNGTLTRSTSISVSVSDFNMTSIANQLTIVQDSSKTVTVSLASLNGFAGTVSLTMFSSPTGLGLAASPSAVTLASGGSGTADVTVSASGSVYNTAVALGDYNVTVRASSGQTLHLLTVRVTIFAQSPVSGNSLMPLLAEGILAVAVAAVFALYAWRRRTR